MRLIISKNTGSISNIGAGGPTTEAPLRDVLTKKAAVLLDFVLIHCKTIKELGALAVPQGRAGCGSYGAGRPSLPEDVCGSHFEAQLHFPYTSPAALPCLMFPCFSTFTCQPAPINPHSSPPPHSGVHSSMAGGWRSRGHKKRKMASAGTAPKKLLQIIPRLHLSRRIWLAAAGKEF